MNIFLRGATGYIAVLNCMEYRPNPQPLPCEGRGARVKASLLLGERNGSEVKTVLHPSENCYIGSIVAQRLKETDHNVFGLTRSEASAQKLKALEMEPVLRSLQDREKLKIAARSCDGVIHTAYTGLSSLSFGHPLKHERTNSYLCKYSLLGLTQ
ncbi:NAD-dependent epimerase/dehydratase family protein [Nostoc sp.]|uniref:NAD-dependent epimerase/dehydratase family protein n=1 Tax=Nostoc sp. TaxID=1180 RepID=UPI002FF72081